MYTWDTIFNRFRAREIESKLRDIEKVFMYFNGNKAPSVSLADLCGRDYYTKHLDDLENEYFKINVYKKGTIHFTIKDENLIRRFNIFMGQRRQWLPPDYAFKQYKDCNISEKSVIDSFEGEKEYTKQLNDPLLIRNTQQLLRLEAA